MQPYSENRFPLSLDTTTSSSVVAPTVPKPKKEIKKTITMDLVDAMKYENHGEVDFMYRGYIVTINYIDEDGFIASAPWTMDRLVYVENAEDKVKSYCKLRSLTDLSAKLEGYCLS